MLREAKRNFPRKSVFKAEIMNCDGQTLAITPAMKLVVFFLRFCESYMPFFKLKYH